MRKKLCEKVFKKIFETQWGCFNCPCQDCEEDTQGCGNACEKYGNTCLPLGQVGCE